MLNRMDQANVEALPPIVLSSADNDRLSDLALAASASMPAIAGALTDELNRADVVAPHRLPADTVAMYSLVQFRDEATGRVRTVRVVYPQDADIAEEKVSVLTPVGVALIGLSTGQSMLWRGRDGASRKLTVLRVSQSRVGLREAGAA
jgi:regulator of nucleoside diphosphate kinase